MNYIEISALISDSEHFFSNPRNIWTLTNRQFKKIDVVTVDLIVNRCSELIASEQEILPISLAYLFIYG